MARPRRLARPSAICFILHPVTKLACLLRAVQEEHPAAAEKLLPLVYDELRRIASKKMAKQPAGHTLQATALVHEAFLRLLGDPEQTWQNRRHFFAAASETMRHILVDRARKKAALRHGSEYTHVDLDDVVVACEATDESVVVLNDALDRLSAHDSVATELVKLRFFAGFTFLQAAELLEISERTAKRRWAYARAWLFNEIQRTPQAAG